ncbi:iron complex outermembrane recepter protein [Desulfurobacterium pacificum]|uniref:Iron complex outermembrane recepter protein n=1 Tax=Desulfurobacterium pacificum TaxID=240166 RepID=A0ABY1NEQ5_9BACT|nr:TonB-dependent receptor [Desulfurobacterium pacificum]SMP07246.1 iron complex outermembrane recepter protein [Desulfurobacterium pacificum]
MRYLLLISTVLAAFTAAQGAEITIEGKSLTNAQVKLPVKNEADENAVIESLELLPGVSLNLLSPSPSPQDRLLLRGFSPERVFVYYGDYPLNGSGIRGNYYVDLSSVPSEDVKRIDVIYGNSVIYGSNPGGNVIFEPPGFPIKRETKLQGFTGSYGTVGGNFIFRNSYGTTGIDIRTGAFRTSGYLRNDFTNRWDGTVTVYKLLNDRTSVKFFAQRINLKKGMPVLNDPSNPATNYDSDYPVVKETYFSLACAPFCKLKLIENPGSNFIQRNTTRFGSTVSYDTGNGLISTSLYLNRSFKSEDYYGFFKTPAGVKLTAMHFEGTDDRTYGLRNVWEDFSFYGLSGTAGVEFQNSGHGEIDKNTSVLAPENYNALRRYAGFFSLKKELRVSSVSFNFNGGLRIERWKGNVPYPAPSPSGTEFLPSLSLGVKLGKVKFGIGAGRVYRAPKAEELLWYSKEYQALKAIGRAYDLKAERGWDYELSASTVLSGISLTARAYYYDIKDFIVSNFYAAQTLLGRTFPDRIIENLDYYKVKGIELAGNFNPYSWCKLYASYAYQTSNVADSDLTPDKTPDPSVLVPKHKLVTEAVLGGKDSFVTLKGTFYSKRKGYDVEKVPGFGVFDLSYNFKPVENVSFVFKVNNLFNKKYFYVENYQMPGRNYLISMNVAF